MDSTRRPQNEDDRHSGLLKIAAEEAPYAVFIADDQGRIVYVNRTFTQILGFTFEDVKGQPLRDVLYGGNTSPADDTRKRAALEQGETIREDIRTYTKAGEETWLAMTLQPRVDADGHLTNIMGSMDPATELRLIESMQRDVLEAVATDMPLREVMRFICTRAEQIFPEVVVSVLAVDEHGLLRPLAAPSLPDSYSRAIDGAPIGPVAGSCGTAAYRGEAVTVRDIEIDPLWDEYKALVLPLGLRACWSSPIMRRDGSVAGTFAFYFHRKQGPSVWHERVVAACVQLCVLAMERNDAQERIRRLAYFDTLTGLPNRTMLQREMRAAFARAPEQPRAFIFLDLDRFKDVNDTMGHSLGDALLVEVAQRLKQQVGPDDIVCRHGGDEFVIVLSNGTGVAAAQVAERLEAALMSPPLIPALSLPITTSIGISLYPRDGNNTETLLKNADMAMYCAKADGRARYRFFADEMLASAQERLLLGAALREAISARGLQLFYQPQVSARDGHLVGVEALSRWRHPVLGDISPDRFIPLAEEGNQIIAIGEWALDEACRQLSAWDDAGVRVPTVSVNISPLHFRTTGLLGTVREALRWHGLTPDRLALEITEGVVMDDCATSTHNARALSSLGVRLSMDDFGTGYSSLSHLARLPVDELKVDRCFVQEIEESDSARSLATAIIRIGHSLGLKVVAEGVETEGQRRFLQALDCDTLQGFLFSRALPPDELVDWISPLAVMPREVDAA
jgi:diguanylate cyclase (GGDEF)-like protein/PAS domain S-box-containing protein